MTHARFVWKEITAQARRTSPRPQHKNPLYCTTVRHDDKYVARANTTRASHGIVPRQPSTPACRPSSRSTRPHAAKEGPWGSARESARRRGRMAGKSGGRGARQIGTRGILSVHGGGGVYTYYARYFYTGHHLGPSLTDWAGGRRALRPRVHGSHDDLGRFMTNGAGLHQQAKVAFVVFRSVAVPALEVFWNKLPFIPNAKGILVLYHA